MIQQHVACIFLKNMRNQQRHDHHFVRCGGWMWSHLPWLSAGWWNEIIAKKCFKSDQQIKYRYILGLPMAVVLQFPSNALTYWVFRKYLVPKWNASWCFVRRHYFPRTVLVLGIWPCPDGGAGAYAMQCLVQIVNPGCRLSRPLLIRVRFHKAKDLCQNFETWF